MSQVFRFVSLNMYIFKKEPVSFNGLERNKKKKERTLFPFKFFFFEVKEFFLKRIT